MHEEEKYVLEFETASQCGPLWPPQTKALRELFGLRSLPCAKAAHLFPSL